MGPGQHGTKEGGVPPRVNSMLVQQEEHHPGGQRKNNHHVFQEGTQGLILDPQARHEEFQDVRRDVGNRQQIRPGQGGDP
jgi:hypothetical protein